MTNTTANTSTNTATNITANTKALIRNSLVTVSVLSAVAFSGNAFASSCKGLESQACGAKASCSWVESYTRKDGREVNAFCRAKPSFNKKVAVKSASKKPAKAGK